MIGVMRANARRRAPANKALKLTMPGFARSLSA